MKYPKSFLKNLFLNYRNLFEKPIVFAVLIIDQCTVISISSEDSPIDIEHKRPSTQYQFSTIDINLEIIFFLP